MTPTVAVIGSFQVHERFVLVDACITGLDGQDRYLHQTCGGLPPPSLSGKLLLGTGYSPFETDRTVEDFWSAI